MGLRKLLRYIFSEPKPEQISQAASLQRAYSRFDTSAYAGVYKTQYSRIVVPCREAHVHDLIRRLRDTAAKLDASIDLVPHDQALKHTSIRDFFLSPGGFYNDDPAALGHELHGAACAFLTSYDSLVARTGVDASFTDTRNVRVAKDIVDQLNVIKLRTLDAIQLNEPHA